MDALLPSHPSSYKHLIKHSFYLYRASFFAVTLLSFLLSLTIFIPRLFSDVIGQDVFYNIAPLSPHRLWIIVISLVSLVFFIGILWHMHCVIRKKHEPFIEDIYVGIKKVIYVMIATFIQSAILLAVTMIVYGLEILLHQYHMLSLSNTGLTLTFIIFTAQFFLIVYVATLFLFLVPLIAIENKNILSSLERSIFLVWNHWWRTFSVQITPWICYFILLIMLRYGLHINIHIYFMSGGTYTLGATTLHIIIFTLFIPWVAALLLVQLKDLELRKQLTPD